MGIVPYGEEVELEVQLVGSSDGHPGFLLMCVTTAAGPGISHVTALMQLYATIAGFQAILHLFALMNLLAGTARRLGTMLMPAQMKQFAASAANLDISLKIVTPRIVLIRDFAKTVIKLVTLQQIARTRRHAIIAVNLGTWLRTAGTRPFVTFAIRKAILHASVHHQCHLDARCLLNPTWTLRIVGIAISLVM